jgi:glycosyltransferase involved in cell wall biosynthesis
LEVENNPQRKARIKEEGLTKEREEIAWMKFCDVTTAVSAVDAAYYESLNTDGRRVMLFRNVINLDSYATPPEAAPGLRSPSIFLAGSFWEKSPMEHAARWFLDEVFPRVLATCPAAHLYIAGDRSDQVLADVRHDHVHVLGRVASVLPYLCPAGVAVVPLFFESGTRFKILEAGACRVPVVSTTLGAEGIDVVDGGNILLADEPEAFAAAVVKVLGDPGLARELGGSLHALIAEQYSLTALADEGRTILRALS